ncbi:MAG TPA: glycosyltransferase family 4 protein [Candidatus Thermoplasmatota archaeon]|nr:glycosyltransferase family 4 protein [Candidatus Thermoplasmatota archaeon]
MNVLIASPWLHPHGGGLERYAWSIGRELARAGHEVTLLGHAREPVDETRERVRVVGVAPRRTLSNTPLSLEVHRVARRLARDADVVNVHTPVPGTAELVALAARRAGVPHVVTYHAGTLGAPAGILRAAASVHRALGERWLLRGAAARIAVSPYVAARVFGRLASEVVPPGVDAERFAPQGEPVPGRVLFVGPVSRAYAWKGFAVLADAFERLAQRVPEAHLRVVGQGDLVESYRARFAGRPVTFVGRVEEAQLVREYSRASVVVLPSITDAESFGMCLAEANACARPVVASAIGGIPSFVRDGDNGLLVPAGEPEALAQALERLLADPGLASRLGARGRERVLKEHRWDALAEKTGSLLAQASTR